jgi:hypothetical protein
VTNAGSGRRTALLKGRHRALTAADIQGDMGRAVAGGF